METTNYEETMNYDKFVKTSEELYIDYKKKITEFYTSIKTKYFIL